MRRLVFMLVTGLLASFSFARWATEDEVQRVVERHVATHSFFAGCSVREVAQVSFGASGWLWHAALEPTGFVLLNASTKQVAMAAFNRSDFLLPEEGTQAYQQLEALARQSVAAEADATLAEHASWRTDAVTLAGVAVDSPEYERVDRDAVTWAQYDPYNLLCPGGAPAGCVAIAGAQWMRALRWPVYVEQAVQADLVYVEKGVEASRTYAIPKGTKFNYESILALGTEDETERTRCDVAQLVLYNDILSGMRFSTEVSTTAVGEFENRGLFEFDSFQRYDLRETGYTEAAGDAVLAAAKIGLPVLISLTNPAHAVLGSGYTKIDGVVYLFLNYGSGGYRDAWYALNENCFVYVAYPKRTVQCDPLPKIVSRTPTISWHLPACYDAAVEGFSVLRGVYSASGATYADDLSQQRGTMTADSSLYQFSAASGLTIGMHVPDKAPNTAALTYVWPSFTASDKTTVQFQIAQSKPYWPLFLQVQKVGTSTWKTLAEFGEKSQAQAQVAIALPEGYHGANCQLRLVSGERYSAVMEKSIWYQISQFQVTGIAGDVVDEIPVAKEARSYTFDAPLPAGSTYRLAVRPNFADGSVGVASAVQEVTTSTFGAGAEPETVDFYFASPAAEIDEAKIETTNCSRTCYLKGASVIRLVTSPIIKSLSFHSSHASEYDVAKLITVSTPENGAEGVFDIRISGNAETVMPLNDTMLLTVTGCTERGSTYSVPVRLTFNAKESVADRETVEEYEPQLCWNIQEGDTWKLLTVSDAWLWKHGLTLANAGADADPDGDGLSNLTEYLLGTHPNDSENKDEPLQITAFTVHSDGTVSIEYTPEAVATGTSTFLLQGKATLSSAWEAHEDTNDAHRFFRVKVKMNEVTP